MWKSVFAQAPTSELTVDVPKLTLGGILTFAIRTFFAVAGLVAFFYLILGAFNWITSGGDKEAIEKARNKIQAAVIGIILIFAVLAIVYTLETVVFNRNLCFGISCEITLPTLLPTPTP